MVLITLENVSKSFGIHKLFEGVSFGISDTDKCGIIGVNGAGKSTLLRILMGDEPADGGRISPARDARIEYLSQNPDLTDTRTALEEVLSDGPEEFQVVQAYEAACRAMEEDSSNQKVLDELMRLGQEMDRVDGWGLENDAKTTLTRLGIEDHTKLIGTMSGGQRKRVALARALTRPCDLLILDEPTNHLDVTTVAWLEAHLANRNGGLLLITHDRYFLDRVTNVILEIADRTVYRHTGNYSDFLEARAARDANNAQREQKRAQLAKKELEWLRRGPKARTTKSKSRIDRAHELLNTSYAVEESKVEIDTVESRLGRKVIEIEGISKSYDDNTVLRDFTYFMTRRDRLGVVGPNGAGKSTLLNIIAGRLQPDTGSVEVGQTVVIGYYDQESEDLDDSLRVHDYITDIAPNIPTSEGFMTASQMLELFLFDGPKQWTYIGKLSGGEKRRLYLLSILMRQPNVLLLDEPTNDLDVDTLTVLEDYLDNFGGVVLAVSHDRYFLDRTAEHLLVFNDDNTVTEFPGNYSLWAEREKERLDDVRRQDRADKSAKAATAPPKNAAPPSNHDAKAAKKLEAHITELEARSAELEAEMLKVATDFEAVATLNAQKIAVDKELDVVMERWMELAE